MPTHHVLILGAGAAGVAAATALARHEDIHVTLVGRTHETPYIRMHITGVAFGPTLPETIHAPLPPVTVLADTATHLDPISRIVHLASGAQLRYDAVIIATWQPGNTAGSRYAYSGYPGYYGFPGYYAGPAVGVGLGYWGYRRHGPSGPAFVRPHTGTLSPLPSSPAFGSRGHVFPRPPRAPGARR